MDIKLALDMGISAYRKLMDHEEERFKLPHPQPFIKGNHHRSLSLELTGAAAAGVGMSVGWEQSKRLWLETEDAPGSHSSASRLSSSSLAQQAVATGLVNIDEVDQKGRFVCLKNSSDKDQSLGNWRIERQVLEDENTQVMSHGPARRSQYGQLASGYLQSPSSLVWKSQSSWASGESASLSWAMQMVRRWPCRKQSSVQGHENGEEWEEEEAEFDEGDLYHQPGD